MRKLSAQDRLVQFVHENSGHLQVRPGKYVTSYSFHYYLNGKKRSKSFNSKKTLREIRAEIVTIIAQVRQEKNRFKSASDTPPAEMSFAEILEWYEHEILSRTKISKRYRQRYAGKKFLEFLIHANTPNKKAERITAADIRNYQGWLLRLGISRSSSLTLLYYLREIFRIAVQRKRIVNFPFGRVNLA